MLKMKLALPLIVLLLSACSGPNNTEKLIQLEKRIEKLESINSSISKIENVQQTIPLLEAIPITFSRIDNLEKELSYLKELNLPRKN